MTGAWPPQDQLWRLREDVGSRPHRQDPLWRTWGCVHADRSPVSSGPAVEDVGPCPHRQEPGLLGTVCGARGEASSRTEARPPQDPLWRMGCVSMLSGPAVEYAFPRLHRQDPQWRTCFPVHTNRSPASSGPAVEASRGCWSKSTQTGPSPHRQNPQWKTWLCVRADRTQVSSGPAAGGEGEEKPPEPGLPRGPSSQDPSEEGRAV